MANRVVITICGEEYTLVADETSAYMQKVGSCVSDKMTEVMNDAKVGRTDAAVLTAVNLTDELFKSQAAAEQLRSQIKGYLDEASKAQAEVSELKREIFRLQQRLTTASNGSGTALPPPGLRKPSGPPSRAAAAPSIWVGGASTPAGAPKIFLTKNSPMPSGTAISGASGSF